MIDEADRDGDGEVNEEEFLRIMKKTNLDNSDPRRPRQLRFDGAATIHGTRVDLWVEWLDGAYRPSNPSKNGFHGQLGQINLGANDTTKFRFSFVNSSTQAPAELSEFFFEFYDIDQGENGIEMLTMESGAGTYFPGQSLQTTVNDNGTITFQSRMIGSAENNPYNP